MPRRRRVAELCSAVKEKPQQRNAANARERARMRVLSRAFCRLKTTLPWVPPDTKLSKLDTLRLATSYIAHLRAVLSDEASAAKAAITITTDAPHPLTFTWPFSFAARSGPTSTRGELNDLEDDLEEDDDDDDWSSDVTPERPQHHQNNSFLSAHFSDTLMDIS